MSIPLKKIISGGQTGVDIAALRAVRAYNEKSNSTIETGGYCPHNYMTCAGPNGELASFNLKEVNNGPLAEQYKMRSCLNVQLADATLAFRFKPSTGTDHSIAFATTSRWGPLRNCTLKNGEAMQSTYKPTCVITRLEGCTWSLLPDIRAFLLRYNVHTLNICGHRDVCYERAVQDFLEILFHDLFKKENSQ